MKLFNLYTLAFGLTAIAVLALAGCGQQASGPDASQVAETSHEGHDHEGHDHAGEEVQIHGGWWCYEHAVPEEQCAMCDAKLAAELREKGDWCDEHMRPDSLCFQCHPENAEKFVALFEAKYGKTPPQATD